MAILTDGTLRATYADQFDKQLHSVEWFTGKRWKRLLDTLYPVQDAEVLDDTLDYGAFRLMNEEAPFPDDNDPNTPADEKMRNLKQLTPIRILWDSEDEEFDVKKPVEHPIWRYKVVDEVNFARNGRLYKFTIKTVEATKLLERYPCDTLTFTNYLERSLGNGDAATRLEYDAKGATFLDSSLIPKKSVKVGQTITIPTILEIFDIGTGRFWYALRAKNTYDVKITFSSGDVDARTISSVEDRPYRFDIDLNHAGLTTIEIVGEYYYTDFGLRNEKIYAKWYINTWHNQLAKPYLTISDCLKRVVEVGKTRRNNIDKQKFFITHEVLDKYADIRAPEFHLTRPTTWEALKTISSHVHCIPRLTWNEETNAFDTIAFDELGGNKPCKMKARYDNRDIAHDLNKTLDNFCGQIETYVDNLVNTQNFDEGTIVEPFNGGWISARASDGQIEIKDDTVCFKLGRPGYRISKLEVRYNSAIADITPYLYEAAEYETLSDFDKAYPYSTAYALKYQQGGTEICEFTHCSKDKNWLKSEFKREAILNIMAAMKINIASGRFKDIEYRITYLPMSSARIIQRKPYLGDATDNTMFYNVSANTVENDYLGGHLKGAIARLGNDTELRTYLFDRCKDIPKPGDVLDGMYITKVITEITSRIYIKATLTLAKDYNQKNEYVAIDSNFRLYDVSEKQSVDRHINYGEDVIIGDQMTNDGKSMISAVAIDIFRKTFTGDNVDEQVSWAVFQGVSKQYEGIPKETLKKIMLPCLSQAIGNSLLFNFACKDNYGAGYQTRETISTDNPPKYKATQTLVPYGNIYGEFEEAKVIFGNYSTLAEVKTECDRIRDILPRVLPEWTETVLPLGLMSSASNAFIVGKDSRECINFTYQLHFIANRRNIIIGSALGQNNPLVSNNQGRSSTCYLLDEPINKFADCIDVSNQFAVVSNYMPNTVNGTEFNLPSIKNTTDSTKYAIAWVDESGGKKNAKLILGENKEVRNDGNYDEIFFGFSSNAR